MARAALATRTLTRTMTTARARGTPPWRSARSVLDLCYQACLSLMCLVVARSLLRSQLCRLVIAVVRRKKNTRSVRFNVCYFCCDVCTLSTSRARVRSEHSVVPMAAHNDSTKLVGDNTSAPLQVLDVSDITASGLTDGGVVVDAPPAEGAGHRRRQRMGAVAGITLLVVVCCGAGAAIYLSQRSSATVRVPKVHALLGAWFCAGE